MLIRLRQKALFPVALLGLICGLGGVFSLYALDSLSEINKKLAGRYQEIEAVSNIESRTAYFIAPLISYLIRGEQEGKRNAAALLAELPQHLQSLSEASALEAQEHKRLDRVKREAFEIRQGVEKILALHQGSRDRQLLLLARLTQEHLQPLHKDLQYWHEEGLRAVKGLEQQSATQKSRFVLEVILLFVAALGIFASAFWLYENSLVKPLLSMSQSASILASGNLKHRAKVTTRDEVGMLARDINRMAASLDALTTRLNQAAETDVLTGLLNRRAFETLIQREIGQATPQEAPLAVAILDIDNFKNINDTYGHAAGDMTLKTIAQLCTHHIRGGDYCFRYGGEEFIVMMPGTTLEEARVSLERFREAVEDAVIPDTDPDLRVTVSYGLAVMPQDGTSRESLVQHADDALYVAKQSGRNRGICFSDLNVNPA
jgi:diguanylate cyclase (GGDEF)-like protein